VLCDEYRAHLLLGPGVSLLGGSINGRSMFATVARLRGPALLVTSAATSVVGCAHAVDTSEPRWGFTLTGEVRDAVSGEVVVGQSDLCVTVADPALLFDGEGPAQAISDPVRPSADGVYELSGISTTSTRGVALIVDDCEASTSDDWFRISTLVDPVVTTELDYGEVFTLPAMSATTETVGELDEHLARAGYQDDALVASGFIFGAAVSATVPEETELIGGAIVSVAPSDGTRVYYGDATSEDGWFTTGGVVNESTGDATMLGFVHPGARVGVYAAAVPPAQGTALSAGTMEGEAMYVRLPPAIEEQVAPRPTR